MTGPIVAVENASQRFGPVVALQDVSLDVHRARVTCLLGGNGAGKSTLIKLISGVLVPTAGHIRVDGKPVTFTSPRDARSHGIATVYQDLALAPLMSVWRNFVLGSEPTLGWGFFRRLDVGRSRDCAQRGLERLGIELNDLGTPVGRLSGGERQAIAIARAVHFGARVLVLDEPTAALGVRQADRVLDSIERAKDRGVAVLLITHNPSHAYRAGDDFVVLRHGRVAGRWIRAGITELELSRAMAGEEPAGPPQ